MASVAYACQTVTTAQVSPGSAAAGTAVTVTGNNYGTNTTTLTTWGPITIRIDDVENPANILATVPTPVQPATGSFSVSVTIPAGTSVGSHTIIVTQQNASNGTPKSGSPGRASIDVTASGASASSAAAAPVPASSDTAATPAAAQTDTGAAAATAAPTASAAPAAVVSAHDVTPAEAGQGTTPVAPAGRAPVAIHAQASGSPAAATGSVEPSSGPAVVGQAPAQASGSPAAATGSLEPSSGPGTPSGGSGIVGGTSSTPTGGSSLLPRSSAPHRADTATRLAIAGILAAMVMTLGAAVLGFEAFRASRRRTTARQHAVH
ncbi:MAG TPA: hypothetical protein VFJ85_16505 [Acidimicrobiales bacterium]|nr:hypothetical protein [Acidimicrobiales bacterium]